MESSYVVLDFETTGFSAELDRVIEVGAVKVINGTITDHFQTFVNPEMPIPFSVTRITGITDSMVKSAPRALTVMKELKAFIGSLPVLAHNASFDSRFFSSEMRRNGISAPNEFFCSMLLARRILPELSSYKLEDICAHYGISNDNAHRALSDVIATFEVFKKMCQDIKDMSGRGDVGVGLIQDISRAPKNRLQSLLSPEVSMF